MTVQPRLIPEPPPEADPAVPPLAPPAVRAAPLWIQRMSLLILVVFCVYLGVIVTVLPWWSAIWDHNAFFVAHPDLLGILKLGPVRGIISGFGLLDIWIGISEAIHYREHVGPLTTPPGRL